MPDWSTLEPGALILGAGALATLRYKLALGWTLSGCAALGAAYVPVVRAG